MVHDSWSNLKKKRPNKYKPGILQLSKLTTFVGCDFHPIFCSSAPKESPGVPSSTKTHEIP